MRCGWLAAVRRLGRQLDVEAGQKVGVDNGDLQLFESGTGGRGICNALPQPIWRSTKRYAGLRDSLISLIIRFSSLAVDCNKRSFSL